MPTLMPYNSLFIRIISYIRKNLSMSITDKDVSSYDFMKFTSTKYNSLTSFHNKNTIQYPSIYIYECGIKQTGTWWNITGAQNPFWRFYYNIKHGNKIRVKGETIALGPNHIVILPSNIKFDCIGLTEVPHFWIHFSLEPSFAFHADIPILLNIDNNLLHNIAKIAKMQRLADNSTDHARSIYHTCAALLHNTITNIDIIPEMSYPPTLNRLLYYIRNNPDANLSNSELSRMVGMSREGFIRWFTKQIGSSPGHHVTSSRIEYSEQLLLLTNRSIEDIAETCGFANRYYFTRIFTRHKNCGPAKFRKQNYSK